MKNRSMDVTDLEIGATSAANSAAVLPPALVVTGGAFSDSDGRWRRCPPLFLLEVDPTGVGT